MEFQMMEFGFKTNLEFGELYVAGNDEFGFRPYQLMISSIVGCSAGLFRTVLQKKRMEIKNITIKTNIIRNEKNPNKIEKLQIHYEIDGQNLEKKKVEQALEMAKKHCPMVQAVKNNIEVIETVTITYNA